MAYNPSEKFFLENLERAKGKEGEDTALGESYERASRILEEEALKPADFADVYGAEEIQRDTAYVAEREKAFIRERTEEQKTSEQHARVLEGIVHEQIKNNEWLGQGSNSVKTSRFDDIMHGVDEVVEFPGEGDDKKTSRLALAIDVTFSNQLKQKISRIEEEIQRGDLAEVKYWRSGEVAEPLKIPRVIIGAEMENVKKLEQLWRPGKEAELARHPFQMLILEEFLKQFRAFGALARKHEKDEIADMYEDAEKFINRIYRDKIKNGLSPGKWEDDRVFGEIKKQLENLAK